MKTILATIVFLLAAATAGSALSSEIYKWVDEDGNVHYGDRPAGEAGVERVAIVSRPTNSERVQAGVDARLERDAKRDEAREARAAEEEQKAELRAEAEDRAQKCSRSRDRLQAMVTARRLYREDDNGERVYLDESEMQSARDRIQQQVEDYCSS